MAQEFPLWRAWLSGAHGGRRCKVWLKIDRAKLLGTLLDPKHLCAEYLADQHKSRKHAPIPQVEACYIGTIPPKAICAAILIYAIDARQFVYVPDIAQLEGARRDFLLLCKDEWRDPKASLTADDLTAFAERMATSHIA